MFQFPFGTMHQLNLDWFLQQWQQLCQDWIDEQQNIEDSMQDVYDARDAAIQAKDDAVSAKNDAESAQAGVHADALMAEGFAVGEQNGTPVGPGDPYYQSNAKFYSIEAGTYRYLSEAYARGTMGGTPVDPGDAGHEDNAKYYKDAADLDAQSASADAGFAAADALKAEGYAVGEQNGTPVSSGDPYYHDNAKYYAAEAQQDKEDADTFKAAAQTAALKSEGFAVGEQNGTPVSSGSPYYENNAEYYKDLAASVVLGADGAAAQAMIAGEEVSTTITADYDAGSYIRVQGTLYRTTVDLETGDTLTVGTNCVVAVLGDDVSALKSDLDNVAAGIVVTIGPENPVQIKDGANNRPADITADLTATKIYHTGKNFFPINIPANVIAGTISGSRINSAANARVYAIPCPQNTDFFFQRDAGATGLTIATSNKLPAVGDYINNAATMSNNTTRAFNTGSDSYIIINLSATNTQAQLVSMHTMISIGPAVVRPYEAYIGLDEVTVTNGVPDSVINTFLGNNVFWSDNDTDLIVEYAADTKLYIDNKIAELQALILENG